jgi:hypothetical protein
MTIIHEFHVPLWVQTPLGEGQALAITDYGIDHNPIFLVRLQATGQFKSIDANDCRGVENVTFGIARPTAPTGGEA